MNYSSLLFLNILLGVCMSASWFLVAVYKPQIPASTRASQAPPTPPIRHAPACGRYRMRPLPRVVNGVPAAKCEFPWVAGLFKYGTIVNCGASVVSDRFVVTASHCVQEQAWAYRVQAGKHFLDSSRDSTLQSRGVARIIRNPDYSSNGIELDDIALLELDAPLALNECVQPICLPQSGQSPLPFQDCTVAGWGLNSTNAFSATQPESLQRVDLTVYSAHACRQTFGKDSSLVRDTMLCAANGLVGGKDACTGDSGGPLMCLHDNHWTLFGIVSMGYGCALPGEPGYYTAVAHYRSWLDSYLNQRRFSG